MSSGWEENNKEYNVCITLQYEMRKALVIGIDDYVNINSLHGCVNDACAVAEVLKRHSDGTKNFDVKQLTCTSKDSAITVKMIREDLESLFNTSVDVALFYFAGHGHTEKGNGYIVTSDSNFESGHYGLPMRDIVQIVAKSKVKNKILVFDCCFAGEVATNSYFNDVSEIPEGTTILSACTKGQYALEDEGSGVFTKLFVDALNGSAASIVGKISPGSVYSHIDQSLGEWAQRPVFKTNIERFVSLRDVPPRMPLSELRLLTELFLEQGSEFGLNPSFEFTDPSHIDENVSKFKILQKMEGLDLVRPVGEEHMYFAAMNNKSCKLTTLGEHYWSLVKKERI